MSETVVSRETIRDGLNALGIKKGDVLIVHSDLRRLARARVLVKLPNCGADAMLDGMLDAVGPEGILCLPVFTSTFLSPRSGPTGDIFDPATSPSRVGSVTNVFRLRPDVIRSLHPTHSWAAAGSRAAEFVEGHERTSTFGRDSICGRMYDWDGKIVFFDTHNTSNTSTHFPEDWLDLPCNVTEDALVKGPDGRWVRTPVTRAPSGPRDFYDLESKVQKKIDEWGIAKVGKVHGSTVKVFRHREFINHLIAALIEDPNLLLKDGVDDAYHNQMRKLNVEQVERLKSEHGNITAWLGCDKQ